MNKTRRTKSGANKQTYALVYWTETNEVSVLDSRCVIDKTMLTNRTKKGMVEFGEPSLTAPPGGWPRFLAKVLAVSENDTELRKLEDEFIKNGKLEQEGNTSSRPKRRRTHNNNSSGVNLSADSNLHNGLESSELLKKVNSLEEQLDELRTKNSTLLKLNWQLQEALLHNLKQNGTNRLQVEAPVVVNIILLIFGENKRKISLAPEKCNLKGLREEITKDESLFQLLGNPEEILFQFYNDDFEEYVDLELTDKIPDKSKIKAIKMNSTQTESLSSHETQIPEVIMSHSDEGLEGLSSDSEPSRSVHLCSDEMSPVVSLNHEHQNFDMPQFSPFVEECLRQNKVLTATVRKKIVEAMYQKIVSQTIYPGRQIYRSAVITLIAKYPYLRDRVGNGYRSWITALRNKFRNERKKFHGTEVVEDMRRRFGKASRRKINTMEKTHRDDEEEHPAWNNE